MALNMKVAQTVCTYMMNKNRNDTKTS